MCALTTAKYIHFYQSLFKGSGQGYYLIIGDDKEDSY